MSSHVGQLEKSTPGKAKTSHTHTHMPVHPGSDQITLENLHPH